VDVWLALSPAIHGYVYCRKIPDSFEFAIDFHKRFKISIVKKSSRKDRKNKGKPKHRRAGEARKPEHRQHDGRPEVRPAARRTPRFSREIAVLYEDDAVIVLNKPPGLLAVPIKGSNVPSALSLLTEELKSKRQRALVVHRIDRFASGILLFAKTNPDRDSLIQQFLAHTPVRQYLAVVRGQLPAETQILVHYFKRDGMFQQLRTAKDRDATRAELHYSADRVFRDASLVRVNLITGLQNQIRAQFFALGHPIIGDRKYQPREAAEPLIDRVALHAAHLEFAHPRTGKTVTIDCELPGDFENLVRQLERRSGPAH
jgi:23S rRNA pseudouridine1911/1915/1917 synthase